MIKKKINNNNIFKTMLMATTKSCAQNVLFDNTMFYFLFPLLGGAIHTSPCRSTHTHIRASV